MDSTIRALACAASVMLSSALSAVWRYHVGRATAAVSALCVLLTCCGHSPARWSPPLVRPCTESRVYGLLNEGKLFSALRTARAESVRLPSTRATVHVVEREPVCSSTRERDALVSRVLAELGACAEAQRLTPFNHDCQEEALSVSAMLERAAALRHAGNTAQAERLACRAVQATLAAGQTVAGEPLSPPPFIEGYPDDEEEWGPSMHFHSGALCVKGQCLLPSATVLRVRGVELSNGFAPRRFEYPGRLHPRASLRATETHIQDDAADTRIELRWPHSVVPDPHTDATIADLSFTRDGGEAWALSENGRLLAMQTSGGGALVDVDLTKSCPRPRSPFRLVPAPSANRLLAHLGPTPGCTTLVDTKARTVSALEYAAGSEVALSGNGRVAAVWQNGKVKSYDLDTRASQRGVPLGEFSLEGVDRMALSFNGDVLAVVVPGKESAKDDVTWISATLLRLVRLDGVLIRPDAEWVLGYYESLINGDLGERVFTIGGRIWDYRGRQRATVLEQGASLATFFPDGTVEMLSGAIKDAYACRFGRALFPAEDCADYVERRGKLSSLLYGDDALRPR